MVVTLSETEGLEPKGARMGNEQSPRAPVGTRAWARATGGRLDFRDKLTLLGDATALLVRDLPKILGYRLKLQRKFPPAVDLDRWSPPDTAAAKSAETLLRELAEPFMVNHSIRTYWFSRLIGESTHVSHDDEVLYVASLLHDLGFYGIYREGAECFAVRGGEAAFRILMEQGWEEPRAERVAEAITLHVNGVVPPEQGHEAHLMERGVLMDATGLNAWDVHPDNTARVFERLPFLDQRQALWAMFNAETRRYPRCRGHFAKWVLGFGLMVKTAPWK
jgi:hypothetical protein